MVSELFLGVLRGIGSPTSVSSISKNTRDEVLWRDAVAPWRRSSMWLLIRVSVQLVVSRSPGGSHILYKEIMLVIMSHILKSANRYGLPPDLIHCMAAKIVRRLQKLSGAGLQVLPNFVMASINSTLQQTLESLAKTWKSCQRLDSQDPQLALAALSALKSKLNFEQDTLVKLTGLDKYIEDIQGRQSGSLSARFMPSSLLLRHMPTSLPNLDENHFDDHYAAANLMEFERWVAKNMSAWVHSNVHANVCGKLHDLMVQYLRLARKHYDGNPEGTSIMVLTMFELWVACDKAALRQCPWLSEYDPGIPTDALHNLLLPFFGQMKILHELEDYINSRKDTTMMMTALLFSSNCQDSFSSRYFDKSDTHQALLSRIEQDATAARQQKVDELKKKKAEYDRLNGLFKGADHQYITKIIKTRSGPPKTKEENDPKCQKCSYLRQREALKIEIHEWPLPGSPFQAKAVAFELDIPPWFANWRTARSVLLQDLLQGEGEKVGPLPKFLLSRNDPHLSRRHPGQHNNQRIDLLSKTKPAVRTHYNPKKVTDLLEESEVCVPNGLDYHYYDTRNDEYLGDLAFPDAVLRDCMYMVPSQSLQQSLFRPASATDGREPNAVIASQDACPQNMTIEEFKELGTLPLGHSIQWANILLQLAMPSIDFKKAETTSFLLQCAYQAGARLEETPPSRCSSNDLTNILRSSHDFFNSKGNFFSLLENLKEALRRVKSNWESSQAVLVFAAIAARALSLNSFTGVQKTCLEILSSARSIAMGWVATLREKAFAAVDHNDKSVFTAKSVELALICTSTFDLSDRHLKIVLAQRNNASMLVQASIVVQEGEHTLASNQEPLHSILAMRHRRLLCRAYKIIVRHPTELDDAIRNAWSAYIRGSTWQTASETADHWMTTDTLATAHTASMTVHYNLLSGELLVNGLPLGQPPDKYRTHPQYTTLFGKAVVEIMPSSTPGFQFSTKRKFGGYSVQLGMSGDDLFVRATNGSTTYETIPNTLFRDAYPTSFVKEYVHWLNLATGMVQFRPVNDPWASRSATAWTLSRYNMQWRLSKSLSCILPISSLTSKIVSRVLGPLADETQIHSVLQPSLHTKTLLVSIPKLHLSFNLSEGSDSLESNEYRSMVVDADQSLGTLVGLRSKLLLKHSTTDDRMVLVPESEEVKYRRENDHISVYASKSSIIKVHELRVDPQLGRLLDNGELGCKLFLVYLHALTSFCLPDPLTHKTGTEQALTILKSAAVHSFDQLSQEQVERLVKIANLSPGRSCYPPHLRVMQTVHWDNNISFLSQHGHFFTEVKKLLGQARSAVAFTPDSQLDIPSMERTDEALLRRDNIRSSIFRVSGFGAEDHTVHSDEIYDARDRDSVSKRATLAFTMARLNFRDGVGLHYRAPEVDSLWKTMLAFGKIHGAQTEVKLSDLKYCTSLLEDEKGLGYVAQHMLALHRCLPTSTASQQHRFSIIMWLSTLASQEDANLPMLQAVAMLLKSTVSAQISAPGSEFFEPKAGYTCSKTALSSEIERFTHPFKLCPEQNLSRFDNETLADYNDRCHREWRRARDSAVASCVDALAAQWPCEIPARPFIPNLKLSDYINVYYAMRSVRSLFKRWYDNRLLHNFLESMEQTMLGLNFEPIHPVALIMSTPEKRASVVGFVSEHDIFSGPAPMLPEDCPTFDHDSHYSTQDKESPQPTRLGSVIKSLEGGAGQSKYKKQYAEDLRKSLDALKSRDGEGLPSVNVTSGEFSSYLRSCTDHAQKLYGLLEAAVGPSASSTGIRSTYQRPRVSPTFFLKQLSRSRWHNLSDEWKACTIRYALALTAMQRAERLTKLTEKQDLAKELQNPGHQNWDPAKHPEALLMEVESGFLIRPVQTQVAEQMQNPPRGDNAVMQLNMGEGKSSVIVPIVAAALADGNQLVRVVVAKPQSKQMAKMLISKLGGLLDRRVYYMPISRSLKLDSTASCQLSRMLHKCMSSGGVLLVQPEHILSFQLMALECYILDREDVGRRLMSTLDFLGRDARDIVDESDENFNVRFELIYTMGTQRPIELSPDRWLLMQKVLDLVRLIAPSVAKAYPKSVEYQHGAKGCFPRFRILSPDAGALLKKRLAEYICDNGLGPLQVCRQPEAIRKAVRKYITKVELTTAEVDAVEKSQFWTDTTSPLLLLIRGIIACGVLEFVLTQKRWRVNYGLAYRTPPTQLAVPYRAKDSPSLRSEFSHPDVVIALTSLSYYYGGLTDDDLFIAMERLVDSDQPDKEYEDWVRDSNRLSEQFKQLQGINLKDRPQCKSKVFPPLRYAKSAIDFFLAQIVFPKQMKEFPHKLSASGWDIGKRKGRPLTGFSGTNDSRWVLPTDVHHLDHPEQKHTNALVLEYMLQPENGVVLMEPAKPGTSDAEHLLATVLNLTPAAQVILDVGAQIIELTNIEVAKTWLLKSNDSTKEAAVFVNDDDELCVVDREGRVDLLHASSFFTRMDSCLVFLDEAHTRGIDLRLPTHYRAAVTLGSGLTKDRLAQACMRMRKLGKGQTVVFCISQEIQSKIIKSKHDAGRSLRSSSTISLMDVVLWAISETHVDLHRNLPLWAVQGSRFVRQQKLWQEARHKGRTSLSKYRAEEFQEKEAQSLDDRFRPRQGRGQSLSLGDASDADIQRIVERCREFGELQCDDSRLQEEQERELSPEIEQERQVQRAPPAEPLLHSLHDDVRSFALNGVFIPGSTAYMPAFESLKDTTAAKEFPVCQLAGRDRLLVTADFAKTIVRSSDPSFVSDAFQRPVQWLLSTRAKETAEIDRIIIISPYEANKLYKLMRNSTAATLHLFKPRSNSGYASLDRLNFHTVTAQVGRSVLPRGLAVQLALFSGQLYISSFEDYKEICSFLGISTMKLTQDMTDQGWKVTPEGFIISDDRGRAGGGSGLTESPVGFFNILMSKIRRNGDSIEKTHMGSLLAGRTSGESDFEEQYC